MPRLPFEVTMQRNCDVYIRYLRSLFRECVLLCYLIYQLSDYNSARARVGEQNDHLLTEL